MGRGRGRDRDRDRWRAVVNILMGSIKCGESDGRWDLTRLSVLSVERQSVWELWRKTSVGHQMG